jgi:hypothetical protein
MLLAQGQVHNFTNATEKMRRGHGVDCEDCGIRFSDSGKRWKRRN